MSTPGPRGPERRLQDDPSEPHRNARRRAASDAPADVERARAELRAELGAELGAELRAELGACTEELDRLAEVQRELDEAAAAREDTLRQAFEAARAGAAAPGADLVAPFLRAKLAAHAALGSAGVAASRAEARSTASAATRTPAARGWHAVRTPASVRSAWPRWIAAAAAAAVLVGWLSRVWWMREEPQAFGPTLGDQNERLVRPRGDVTEHLPFKWELEMPSGGSYVLTFWDDKEGSIDAPLRTIRHLKEAEWGEGESEESLPEEIGWTVQSVDATGVLQGTAPTEYARRRAP